jgi:hypothetical protein
VEPAKELIKQRLRVDAHVRRQLADPRTDLKSLLEHSPPLELAA